MLAGCGATILGCAAADEWSSSAEENVVGSSAGSPSEEESPRKRLVMLVGVRSSSARVRSRKASPPWSGPPLAALDPGVLAALREPVGFPGPGGGNSGPRVAAPEVCGAVAAAAGELSEAAEAANAAACSRKRLAMLVGALSGVAAAAGEGAAEVGNAAAAACSRKRLAMLVGVFSSSARVRKRNASPGRFPVPPFEVVGGLLQTLAFVPPAADFGVVFSAAAEGRAAAAALSSAAQASANTDACSRKRLAMLVGATFSRSARDLSRRTATAGSSSGAITAVLSSPSRRCRRRRPPGPPPAAAGVLLHSVIGGRCCSSSPSPNRRLCSRVCLSGVDVRAEEVRPSGVAAVFGVISCPPPSAPPAGNWDRLDGLPLLGPSTAAPMRLADEGDRALTAAIDASASSAADRPAAAPLPWSSPSSPSAAFVSSGPARATTACSSREAKFASNWFQ